MAKYSSFKYGDGTEYGLVGVLTGIIGLFANARPFSLEAWPPRIFTLKALRRILDLDPEERS